MLRAAFRSGTGSCWKARSSAAGCATSPSSEVAQAIGSRVGALVPDAATLQLGIGAVPDAVLAALHDLRGLRVWSEMFSDGVLELDRTGQLDRGYQLIASFCFGTPAVYEFVHRNPRVRMLRTETTNDPAVISRNPRMISINSALLVDPFAQANAARRPSGLSSRIYSGFGGQTDFVVGAMHSAGGRAIIALPSWHQRADVSTIVPLVDGPVTPFQQTHRGDLFATGRLCSSSAANKSARRPRRRGRMPRDTMRQAGWGHAGAARGRGSRRISHRARGGLRGGPG
jgi:hypothetical protein